VDLDEATWPVAKGVDEVMPELDDDYEPRKPGVEAE
jgi:hypothetical protein